MTSAIGLWVRSFTRLAAAGIIVATLVSGTAASAFDPPPLCVTSTSEGGFEYEDCPMSCSDMEWLCTEYCTNDDTDFSSCRIWDVCYWGWGEGQCSRFEQGPADGFCNCDGASR